MSWQLPDFFLMSCIHNPAQPNPNRRIKIPVPRAALNMRQRMIVTCAVDDYGNKTKWLRPPLVPWKEDMLEEPMEALVDRSFDSHHSRWGVFVLLMYCLLLPGIILGTEDCFRSLPFSSFKWRRSIRIETGRLYAYKLCIQSSVSVR